MLFGNNLSATNGKTGTNDLAFLDVFNSNIQIVMCALPRSYCNIKISLRCLKFNW